jgi:hypothetical protein
MTYRLGKLPARINPVHLKLSTYLDTAAILPHIPTAFGHEDLVFGMLGNDTVNDSVWAGAAHETALWAKESGRAVTFTRDSVLSDYSAVTGYSPADPATDHGTDMQVAASYRRRIGVLDASGQRHRIAAYLAVTPGDPDLLAAAAYVFGAVGVGLRFPDYALAEFESRQPWDVYLGVPKIEGGQYVSVVGRGENGNFHVVVWGAVQEMTANFYRRYCDEALVYLPLGFLSASVGPPGFDLARLRTDLEAFTRR